MKILAWLLGMWAIGSVVVTLFVCRASGGDRAEGPGASVENLEEHRAKRARKSGGDAA